MCTPQVKYFVRSEVMARRVDPLETEQDKEAARLWEEARAAYYGDGSGDNSLEWRQKRMERSIQIEERAFKTSRLLENLVIGL
jgi:hypothetical protein